VTEEATASSPALQVEDKGAKRFETPVVCKCGLEIWSVSQGKAHYLVMSVMPWKHVRI